MPGDHPLKRERDAPLYEIEMPHGPERGVRVGCTVHDEWEEFEPGYRTVAFYCEGCGIEIELTLRDVDDWRDWGERC